tara:strand:+ start:361 stop:1173 length:813 start_codon:yes stop_codon:yes gene_type:complete
MVESKIIGIDLGGTNLRVGLVRNNKVVKYIKIKTPKTAQGIVDNLINYIEQVMSKDVKGIGVSSPGPLENGIIKNPPNLPFKNYNLKKVLEKKFKKRVVIENDATCVSLAEAKLGNKKKNFIVLTFGTGIGGGIFINGKPYHGQGYAGELGHMILDDGKFFEDFWQENRELTKKYFGKEMFIKDLLRMHKGKANVCVNQLSNYLGQGIASLINIFDPEVIVLSGGMKETGDAFLNIIKKQAKKYIILPKTTPIKWIKLDHPGVLGASLLI